MLVESDQEFDRDLPKFRSNGVTGFPQKLETDHKNRKRDLGTGNSLENDGKRN